MAVFEITARHQMFLGAGNQINKGERLTMNIHTMGVRPSNLFSNPESRRQAIQQFSVNGIDVRSRDYLLNTGHLNVKRVPDGFSKSLDNYTLQDTEVAYKDLPNKNGIIDDVEMKKGQVLCIYTNSQNQKQSDDNKTVIDLLQCEERLKQVNHIPPNSSLYLIKYEIAIEGMKIPKLEYEVYYPLYNETFIKLDLSECKGMNIEVSYPIKLNDTLDKYNASSGYYNDLCYKEMLINTDNDSQEVENLVDNNENIKYDPSLFPKFIQDMNKERLIHLFVENIWVQVRMR